LAIELWPDITHRELTNTNPHNIDYIFNLMEMENRTTKELLEAIKKLPRADIIAQLKEDM
jgi:hypothetical protein